MKSVLTVLVLATLVGTYGQKAHKKQITPAQIDSVFATWANTDTPGIAVGVLNNGEVVYTKGYGLANLEHQIPIRPDTKFHIGDIAKEFTVYALLLLEQRGQISLQDDIRKHMPELASFPHPISIEQLTHHTGGLNNLEVSKILAGWNMQEVFSKEQAYKMIGYQSQNAPASGETQQFTDAGFMVLEDLIAKIGKTSYSEFVTKEIFGPLGMTHSVFDTTGAVIPAMAQGYVAQKEGYAVAGINHEHTLLTDLYSTVGDMCLWAKELQSPTLGTKQLVAKFDGLSIVNNTTVKETNLALYTGGHRFWNFRGVKKLYHIEVAGGYASKLIRYPEHDLALVVMGNDGAYNGYAATGASALYIENFLDPMPQAPPTIAVKKLAGPQLANFEGDYWDTDNHTIRKIRTVNDTLRYVRGPGNESALVPLGNTSFKMITRGEVMVRFDTKTTPKTMQVTVGDQTFRSLAYNQNASWSKDLEAFTGNYHTPLFKTPYSIENHNGELVIVRPRTKPVQLSPTIPDTFMGNQDHFSSITFQRDPKGEVSGFLLATQGVTDILFLKAAKTNQNSAKTR